MFILSQTRSIAACQAALGLIARVKGAFAARRSRIALGRLDARLLEDIGLSSAIAQQEVHRFL